MICEAHALAESGRGVRFDVTFQGEQAPAFAIRYAGRVHAYLNRCAHISVELDWVEGEFFDGSKVYLVCATHGACYVPDTGACVAGPCIGRSLIKIPVEERDGAVYLQDSA